MTMLEKMARAAAFAGTKGDAGTPDGLWAWMNDEQRRQLRNMVGAALAVAREPSSEMVDAAWEGIKNMSPTETLTAMIDAILNEPQP